jgi:hypothetical protein
MSTKVAAAVLLSAAPILLGQAPNAAQKAPAPNVRLAPVPPTPAPPAAVLHLDGRIVDLACRAPLRIDIVVSNPSATAFGGAATIVIGSAALRTPPENSTVVAASVGPIPAHGSQTVTFRPSRVTVDCAAPQAFVVTMRRGVNDLTSPPEWDRDALTLTTSPPANCSATPGSSRQPHFNPKM